MKHRPPDYRLSAALVIGLHLDAAMQAEADP